MNAFQRTSKLSHRVSVALQGITLIFLAALAINPTGANAAQHFTNGETRDGSYFDHLVDGLAGDPDGGDGISSGDATVEQENIEDSELHDLPTQELPMVRRFIKHVLSLTRLLEFLGGSQ